MSQEIVFRAVMEVLGKPQDHVEKALKSYLETIQKDAHYQIRHQEIADIKKQEKEELWATFAELEIKTTSLQHLITFCFDYMPSMVEILSPEKLTLTEVDLTHFFNDLQIKLHQVDMIAKQMKAESDLWRKNIHDILGNYIILLLSQNRLNSTQLSGLTGVEQDKLEDFLDILIDEGKIDLKEGLYFLKPVATSS